MKYVLIAFVVICGFGSAGYFYWTSTPEYAFYQIKHSVEERNKALFESHVDVKRITGSLVDEVIQMTLSETTKKKSGWAALGGMFAAKLIESMKPQLEGVVEKEISKIFETDRSLASNKLDKSPLKNLVNVRDQLTFLNSEKKECSDQVCYFSISFEHNITHKQVTIQAKMEKFYGNWKLVEFPSLVEQLNKIKT